jgi:hypothetical protein
MSVRAMSDNSKKFFQSTIDASETNPAQAGKDFRFWIVLSLEVALILLMAMLLRGVGLGEEALHDELYNFLAACGLLEHGDFLIVANAEPYNRVAFFTRMVAACMSLFGQTLPVARLPALLAGSILVGVVFVWLRLNGERMAGWLAAILIALDPQLIQLSQIVRFYTLQHLAFLLGSIGVFVLLYHHSSAVMKWITLSLTVASLLLALMIQPVSVFGLGGLLFFAAAAIYWLKIRYLRRKVQQWIAISTGAISCAVIVYAYKAGLIAKFIAMMNYADLWAAASVDNPRFYYAMLNTNYAPLLSLFPLLLLFAVRKRPHLAMLCAAVFGVGFISLSIAAWKAERYFSYLLPFFFVVVAIGLSSGLASLYRYLHSLLSQTRLALISPKGNLVVTVVMVAAIFGFAMLGNYAFLTTARLLTRDHQVSFPLMGPKDGALSWSQAAPKLKQIADEVEVVVASDDLKAIHYIGRVDYLLSPNFLRSSPEFTPYPYTNARMIVSTDAISSIMKCHKSGIYIVQEMSMGQSATSLPRLLATRLVAEQAELIDLPKEWGIIAYRWQTSLNDLNQDCPPYKLHHKGNSEF